MVNWLWSNRKYNVYLQIYRSLQRIRLMTLLGNQLLLLLEKSVSIYAWHNNSDNSFWSIEYKHLLRTSDSVVICFILVLHFTAVVIYLYFYSTSITCFRRCYYDWSLTRMQSRKISTSALKSWLCTLIREACGAVFHSFFSCFLICFVLLLFLLPSC